MAKKSFFLVIDTETTQENTVADFGAVIVDRQGKVYNHCAVLVQGHFDEKELFYAKNETDKHAFWSRQNAAIRKQQYMDMLNSGKRVLASVNALNKWLNTAIGQYPQIELTAYNLPFDLHKCEITGIDLTSFNNRFCLWDAATGNICAKKDYKQFALNHHLINPPTDKGNCTFKTSAEAVYSYIMQQPMTEPHLAYEDAIIEGCSILPEIVKRKKWRENVKPYNWRNVQLRDHFIAK